MNFRTEITLQNPERHIIDYARRGFVCGSCFSENISRRLSQAKFPVEANPTGILFNPLSIRDMITDMAAGRTYDTGDIASDGDLWFSWSHHGSFSDTYPEVALGNMNEAALTGAAALKQADYVIITFGTAWVYRIIGSDRIAANCHKQPDSLFRRERLTPAEITDSYAELMEGPLKGKQVIFTLSPVRHLRDGMEGNSASKAILRVAIDAIVARYGNALYFPAYEIMTDDLRDYRFYADDMLHPSGAAVDYIWEKFLEWAADSATRSCVSRIVKITRAMEHRPLHPGSSAEAGFRQKMLDEVLKLQRELPQINFDAETEYFSV